MMNRFNAPKILIGMFNSEEKNDSDSLLPKIKLLNLLLEGGNSTIQNAIHQIFLDDPNCEQFFHKINALIEHDIFRFEHEIGSAKTDSESSNFTLSYLEMLRLFCEGHNNRMQNYMHTQSASKNSLNLVE